MVKLTIMAGAAGLGLVLVFGLYLLGLGVRNVYYSMASTGWPKTQGVVVASGTTQQTSVDRETQDESVTWSASTVVRYKADVVDRATDLMWFGQTFGSGDISEAELQRVRYPTGKEVSVSYHPHEPWIAVVKPGLHSDAFWLVGAGLAFIVPIVMCGFVLADSGRGSQGFGGGDRGMAIAAALFGAVFCGLGLLGVVGGMGRIWHGYSSTSWPVAEGEVIFSRVTDSTSHDRETRERSTTFSPRFVYRYEVDRREHFNNLRRFGRIEGSGEDWAADISAKYPKGRKVQVRYLPSDPDISVLEPGNTSEAWWLPGAAMAALLFGLAVFKFVVPGIAKPFGR